MNIQKRRGGFYWNEGVPYLSVTEILKCINKPAIAYWASKEVYLAMIKDPTLSEKDALAAPYKTSKKAMSRGSTVHSIIEAFKSTDKRIENIPADYRDYAFAFYDFVQDHQIEILENEKTVMSQKHKIAGTLDMYANLNGKKIVLDIKTGKDIYQEATLQLSAYKAMLEEANQIVDQIAVLLLETCLLYTSPSPRDRTRARMPSSA